jgi:hypothetical protein
MSGRLETMLARLFRRRSGGEAAPPPPPGHRAALEQELLARFGELHPKSTKERTMGAIVLWRAAVVAGLLAAAGGASQAPADYRAEIGKRVTVLSDAPLPPEQLKAAVQAVEAGGKTQQVRVRGIKAGDGPVRTTIELFGETAAMGDIPAIMRKAAPALAALPIAVEPIERTVQGDLGDKVRHLVGMDQLPPDELARLIEAELREADPSAQVKVEVEQSEGRREVRVEVRKEAEAPAEGEAAPR